MLTVVDAQAQMKAGRLRVLATTGASRTRFMPEVPTAAEAGLRGIEATMKSYELYLEHLQTHGLERVLSFTRAWSLLRFVHAKLLDTVTCTQCAGRYVMHAMDLHSDYVCGLCHVPSRAGKTLKAKAETEAQSRQATTRLPVPSVCADALPLLTALAPPAPKGRRRMTASA